MKRVISAEVGGPASMGGREAGYYLYAESENSGSYYENTSTSQTILQASFDMALSDSWRVETGGMYQYFKGNQVAGSSTMSVVWPSFVMRMTLGDGEAIVYPGMRSASHNPRHVSNAKPVAYCLAKVNSSPTRSTAVPVVRLVPRSGRISQPVDPSKYKT